MLESAGWLIASLYSRVMLGLTLAARGTSLPLAVAGPRGGFMGAIAHLPFPFVPMALIPIPAHHMLPKGFNEMPLWGREPGVLLPRLKAWRRDATFICTLARPSFLPQLCTTSTAAAPPALSRASMPPSSRPILLDCGRLVASVSGSGRVASSSASAGGLLPALQSTGRLVLAARAPL